MNARRIIPVIAVLPLALLLGFASPSPAAAAAESDLAITSAVQQSLGDLSRLIQVETKNGVVRMHGNLTTVDEADRAEYLARQVDGVRIVKGEFDYMH